MRQSAPTDVIERHFANNSTMPLPTTQPTLVAASIGTTTAASATVTTTTTSTSLTPTAEEAADPISAMSISFEDPRVEPDTLFELYIRSDLSKLVAKCRGQCGRPITQKHQLVVKSAGVLRYVEKAKEVVRNGPLFIHFKDKCLKDYDTKNYYAPGEPFNYKQITVSESAKKKLNATDKALLRSLGVDF